MGEQFDKEHWEAHWTDPDRPADAHPAHPALAVEVAALTPGAALEAGCGEGSEARWLAAHGWQVLAVDLSGQALTRAASHEPAGPGSVAWVEADLTTWEPPRSFDLVTTFFAHPTIEQHAFYARIAGWVAPGGTLLVVGHADTHGPQHEHPQESVADLARVQAVLDPAQWSVLTAQVRARDVAGACGHGHQDDESHGHGHGASSGDAKKHGHGGTLRDVVVRARRMPGSAGSR